jgi:hypothetical protein
MSDSENTPQGTARINSERFETQLATVWFAANYYYEASYRHGREYIGVVFHVPNEPDSEKKYGLTVRGDGTCLQTKVRVGDVPHGTIPVAVWHTHIPLTACKTSSLAEQVFLHALSLFDFGTEQFSADDIKLSDESSKASRQLWGHRIPIYLVTDTLIKRYQGPGVLDKIWTKERPAHLPAYMR